MGNQSPSQSVSRPREITSIRSRLVTTYGIIITAAVVVSIWAFSAFRSYPQFLGADPARLYRNRPLTGTGMPQLILLKRYRQNLVAIYLHVSKSCEIVRMNEERRKI